MYLHRDLNCDTLKVHNDSNFQTKRIRSLYELYQLSQLIDEPTRITSSLIDHTVINRQKQFQILVLFTLV